MGDGTDLVLYEDTYEGEITEIQRNIDESRARIAQTLEGLQDDVVKKLDWTAWVHKNPRKTVGVALAVGLYLGLR